MKRPKGLSILVVAIMLCMMILSACTKKDASPSPSAAASATPEATANGVAKPDKIVISADESFGGELPEQRQPFLDAIKKATGITVEIIHSDDPEKQVQLKIAAGEQVDMYVGNARNLYLQGAVVPIQKSWVDATTYVKKIPDFYFNNFISNGDMYAVPYRSMKRLVTFVRQDWLDKLGLNVPVTLDDYYNLAKAFALNDPDGNGKADTYLLSASGEFNAMPYYFYPFQNAYTKYPGELAFDTDKKKLIYIPLDDPAYKDYMKYVSKLYQEKLIDPEIFTNKQVDMKNNFYTGKTGMLTFFVDSADEIMTKTKAASPNANVQIIAPPTGPAGAGQFGVTSNVSYSVLKSSKNPEGVFKYLIEYLTSPEGQSLLVYGPEGLNYTMENGIAKVKPDMAANYNMGLNENLVINSDEFKPIFPLTDIVKQGIASNTKYLKINNVPMAPINPQADDLYKTFLEYYTKIISGKLDVDAGMAEWKAKFTESGLNKYFDDANKDTSWFPAK